MDEPQVCPDGGRCHHQCAELNSGRCWRVVTCGPLSGVYPGDQWPSDVVARYGIAPALRRPVGPEVSGDTIKRVMVAMDVDRLRRLYESQDTQIGRETAALIQAYQANVAELEQVNQHLGDAGIDYPLGARGVEDLAQLREGQKEATAEAQYELAEYKRAHPE
jgi:hypothetical protein